MKQFEQEEVFEIRNEHLHPELYFPLASENGLKSAISPYGKGDSKTDQNHFLFAPASILDLSEGNLGRNFWFCVKGGEAWSVFGSSSWQKALEFTEDEEPVELKAGYMWQNLSRLSDVLKLRGEVTSFIPFDENTEINICTLENKGTVPVTGTPVSAFSIYGRSADNLRDHRHVTSLLHRCKVGEKGIYVTPAMSFDERGHQKNDVTYFVEGITGEGDVPCHFIPVLEDFTGEGSLERPEALFHLCDNPDFLHPGDTADGQEMIGALVFPEITLQPGEKKSYILFAGIGKGCSYSNLEEVNSTLEKTKGYWKHKINTDVKTADPEFDGFMRWVAFQPELRRLFGCSFLPHHDYGKGGRGWRDLWQDCLALLLMNPSGVRQILLGNFAGERIDGTNATIIGDKPGEFKADRNAISRVWMDHGAWPYMTCDLYFQQTGDYSLLQEKVPYFKDRMVFRGEKSLEEDGSDTLLRKANGEVYYGTVLEHLLVQNLTAFWDTGENGNIRLRNADWNDALDMAPDKGESVSFTSFYGWNLIRLAALIKSIYPAGERIVLFKELELLLKEGKRDAFYRRLVLTSYLEKVQTHISGDKAHLGSASLAENLRKKGTELLNRIREKEWIELGDAGFYNGYYDNDGKQLEGVKAGKIQMMLTSQVFAIMAGTATDEQVKKIVKSADRLLFDEKCGGYRLNTDFEEVRMNMGRMFGFAYGEKENGAVFSHMAVMFANALYQRGFVKEGYKALLSLYRQSMNDTVSRIYPGLPEYFGRKGRGLYHYLTGSASWYLMTVMNQMFGVRGEGGDLVLDPKLLREQFDEDHRATLRCRFADISWKILYENPRDKEYGDYRIKELYLDEQKMEAPENSVPLYRIKALNEDICHTLRVVLG